MRSGADRGLRLTLILAELFVVPVLLLGEESIVLILQITAGRVRVCSWSTLEV